jgi:phage/plasmid-associated DNA primase
MIKMSQQKNKKYIIYKINTYSESNKKFIENNKIEKSLNELVDELNNNKGFHFRIHKKTQYVFFGDLDNYPNDISHFIILLQHFFKTKYNLEFSDNEFKYTQNNKNTNSYHYSIPKWNLNTEKIKEIMSIFYEENKKEFNIDGKRIVDTTIYSEHWFRCPNQKKGTNMNDETKHVIINGTMEDFIIEYIPKESIDINEIKNISNDKIIEKNTLITKNKNTIKKNELVVKNKKNELVVKNTELVVKNTHTTLKNMALSSTMSESTLYKKMFDECYKKSRFETYEYWISIAMALKNTFSDQEVAFELFNYFSAKGQNYQGKFETEKKFNTFIQKQNVDKYTVATIYFYAIEDNKLKFVEIMNKNTFDLEQSDMCKYLEVLAGKKFIYINEGNIYKLYCYDGKIWRNDDIIMKHFLSNELYDFLKMILVELYFEHHTFNQMKSQIKKLKTISFKKDIVESYKEVGVNNDVKFDDKWYLFGFNNVVYDLDQEVIRDYKYDDYVSTTTGYDWREPTYEEMNTVQTLINQIMKNEEERELYLQILCTCLDGRCLEKFIVFNGNGGNGKGVTNDLLLIALGEYGMIGNNAILFETSKSGSNPEKANIHKKRLVIMREPSEKNKFENSVIKELTGGGFFSSRGHHETNSKKELNLTMIVECNKKPLFSEEPTTADLRRLIDLSFKSSYTNDKKLVDEENNIYLANPYYKESDFQQKHKYALIKILMNAHKKYKKNNYSWTLPKSVEDRTNLYLQMSCNILTWFKDNYKQTNNKKDICKIKDIFNNFTTSDYHSNLSKTERKKYNKSYFQEYVETNMFLKKFFCKKSGNNRNFLFGWKYSINDDSDNE